MVGLADDTALAAGWARLAANIARHRPGLVLDGVLVEESARGVELIVGGRNDPQWGRVILAGFGGVQAEILPDVRLLTPDLDPSEVVAELGKLKTAALLFGFSRRTGARCGCGRGADCDHRGDIGGRAADPRNRPQPGRGLSTGQGLVALDALIECGPLVPAA